MLSKSTGLILILICGLLCLWIIYSVPRFNKKIQNIIIFFSKLGFLVGLFLIAISYLNFAFINSNNLFNLGIEFLLRNLFYLILITTMLGVLASYLVKDNITEDIKKIKDIELHAEQNRIKKFEAKHKRIAISKDNTSAVNGISEKSLFLKFLSVLKYFMVLWIRLPYRIYRRMYIEGWWYSAGLILILTIGSIVQLSIIGDYYFWTDEVFSFNAGMMILEKGKPLFDSGLFYGRARIYHYLMAGSMFLFGIDEFGSRFINVLFSIFTAILIYYLLKDTSKKLGLFGAFLFMFSNLTIAMIIETRFYAFFTFTFLSMAITFYKAFIENLKNDFGDNILKKIKDDRKWLFLFLIVAYIAYNTHDFFFIIIFGLALYYFLSLLIDKSWKINL